MKKANILRALQYMLVMFELLHRPFAKKIVV